MADESGDREGGHGAGIGGGETGSSGTSGPAVGGFGTTNPGHMDSGLSMRPGFFDLATMDQTTFHDMLMGGQITGVLPGTTIGYGPEMSLNAAIAGMGQKGLLGLMTAGAGIPGIPGLSGFTGGARTAAAAAALGRSLGMTGTAQGFPGGTGEPGVSAPSLTGPSSPLAQMPTSLPSAGNPLLNVEGSQAGWAVPYLAGYSQPRPVSPASNQGVVSGGGMGPLYA